MPYTYEVSGSVDEGTRYTQKVTALTPEHARSGTRMEDSFSAWRAEDRTVVAVADGHGSTEVADGMFWGGRESADAALHGVGQAVSSDIGTMFAYAHQAVSSLRVGQYQDRPDGSVIVANAKQQWQLSTHGTTLCVAVLGDDGSAHVGYLGDTMALLVGGGGEIQALGTPHDTKSSAEVARMRQMGAAKMRHYFQVKIGTEEYSLQVSRALGHVGNAMVGRDPEVMTVAPGWEWMVIATDGIWDHLRKADAGALVAQCSNAQEAADKLLAAALQTAKRKKTRDNASVVVIRPLQEASIPVRVNGAGCCAIM